MSSDCTLHLNLFRAIQTDDYNSILMLIRTDNDQELKAALQQGEYNLLATSALRSTSLGFAFLLSAHKTKVFRSLSSDKNRFLQMLSLIANSGKQAKWWLFLMRCRLDESPLGLSDLSPYEAVLIIHKAIASRNLEMLKRVIDSLTPHFNIEELLLTEKIRATAFFKDIPSETAEQCAYRHGDEILNYIKECLYRPIPKGVRPSDLPPADAEIVEEELTPDG